MRKTFNLLFICLIALYGWIGYQVIHTTDLPQCQPGSASVSSGTVPQGTVPGGAGALPGVRFLNNRDPRHPQYRRNRKQHQQRPVFDFRRPEELTRITNNSVFF